MEGGLVLQLRCVAEASGAGLSDFIGVQGRPQHCKPLHEVKCKERTPSTVFC